jgi:hypothetical protein
LKIGKVPSPLLVIARHCDTCNHEAHLAQVVKEIAQLVGHKFDRMLHRGPDSSCHRHDRQQWRHAKQLRGAHIAFLETEEMPVRAMHTHTHTYQSVGSTASSSRQPLWRHPGSRCVLRPPHTRRACRRWPGWLGRARFAENVTAPLFSPVDEVRVELRVCVCVCV